jgi:hypothetical protein
MISRLPPATRSACAARGRVVKFASRVVCESDQAMVVTAGVRLAPGRHGFRSALLRPERMSGWVEVLTHGVVRFPFPVVTCSCRCPAQVLAGRTPKLPVESRPCRRVPLRMRSKRNPHTKDKQVRTGPTVQAAEKAAPRDSPLAARPTLSVDGLEDLRWPALSGEERRLEPRRAQLLRGTRTP